MRIPAANLFRLLQRDKQDAANSFRTLKQLNSPNTWVALPASLAQFMYPDDIDDILSFRLDDESLWQKALGRSLNAGSAAMPPIASYASFPWATSVGEVSPLRLDTVFDDRYFMASNELNLLNTLLLAKVNDEDEGSRECR